MNSNHSKLDVIWTLDEIGGDMHLMGIYDIWPYWVDHQEPINILMWISPAIFFTHIYLQNFCRYALTTTHNDMGLLQNSMPHSIQGLIIILPVNMPVSGHVPFSETPNVHLKKKTNHKFFSWSNHHFGSSNPMISNFQVSNFDPEQPKVGDPSNCFARLPEEIVVVARQRLQNREAQTEEFAFFFLKFGW